MEPWKGMEKSISFSHPLDDQSDVIVKMSKVVRSSGYYHEIISTTLY